MRKKIVNKEKFLFREEEVLPPRPVNPRKSFQSRLVKKSGSNEFTMQTCNTRRAQSMEQHSIDIKNRNVVLNHASKVPHQRDHRNIQVAGSVQAFPSSQIKVHDPVLDEIVAKLKSGLHLGSQYSCKAFVRDNEIQKKDNPPLSGMSSTAHPSAHPPPVEINAQCVCHRPLKLVMCEVCGETFRGRVSYGCRVHPRAMYLQDVRECKWCKQTNKQALKEFDLPAGMKVMK